jgi:sulfhydrogenase subunit beta (sulfur reductase)
MIILKKDIKALLDALSATACVYVPTEAGGVTQYLAYGPGVEPRLDVRATKVPPKELLFPKTERLYRWKRHEGHLSIEQAEVASQPFTVFGIRPCDVASIDRLDKVFLTKGYVDEFYEARRNAATLVALACSSVDPTCFCDSMGGSPSEAPSADVLLRESGDSYVAVAQTERGKQALEEWKAAAPSVVRDGDGEGAGEAVKCTLQVNMDGVAEKLAGMYHSPMWDDIANTCVTCGTCTFVCPTCYCFDISQDTRAAEGARYRCWDSCMFTEYTQMAGGHNPRADKAPRVRQRFMHKLSYFADRYGENLCVGCGRCIADCPAGVDITRIIDRVNAEPAASVEGKAAADE